MTESSMQSIPKEGIVSQMNFLHLYSSHTIIPTYNTLTFIGNVKILYRWVKILKRFFTPNMF